MDMYVWNTHLVTMLFMTGSNKSVLQFLAIIYRINSRVAQHRKQAPYLYAVY